MLMGAYSNAPLTCIPSGPSLEELMISVEKWRSALSYAIESHDVKTMDKVGI